MKRKLMRPLALLVILLGIGTASQAQFSLGLQGGLAMANVEGSKLVAGGGANLRVFTSPNLAIGVAGKMYVDGADYRIAGQSFSTRGTLTPVTGTVDYFFGEGPVKPYIGGDAGVYFSKYRAIYNRDLAAESARHSNFGAAPRAGFVFAFGNMGIQIEGIYHFVFGNKNLRSNTGNVDNINFKSTSQFGGVNVGIIFGLGDD